MATNNTKTKRPLFELTQSKRGDYWAPYKFQAAATNDALKSLGMDKDDGSEDVLAKCQEIADKAVSKGFIALPANLSDSHKLMATRIARFGGKIGYVVSDGAGMGGGARASLGLADED